MHAPVNRAPPVRAHREKEVRITMTSEDATPTGPQLNDVDWAAMSNDNLEALASAVWLDYSAAKSLHEDGRITDEEFRWVCSDAERVRDELVRRDIDRGESWTL